MACFDLKDSLKDIVVKRRLADGEFNYVYTPSGQTMSGRKAALKTIQADNAVYSKLKSSCLLSNETNEEFDARLLKLLVSVPYEVEGATVAVIHQPEEMDCVSESHKTMSLSDLIARRRLDGGEFTYVYIPLDKAISGKKAMFQFLKNQSEVYLKLKNNCRDENESDDAFDSRMMKQMLTVPYEKKKESVRNEKYDSIDDKISAPFKRKVTVKENLPKTPFELEIEKYRSKHEPKHQWQLKRNFMMAHKDSFHLVELVGLAQTFGNIEFLGCTYPPDTMRQVDICFLNVL